MASNRASSVVLAVLLLFLLGLIVLAAADSQLPRPPVDAIDTDAQHHGLEGALKNFAHGDYSHDETACPHHHHHARDDQKTCACAGHHDHSDINADVHGEDCPHHHHHHEHDDDSCPHHHHHDHHHEEAGHHHHHDHEGSDYDWIATVRDGSGAVVSEVPILLSCKDSGMVKLTPLTYGHLLAHTDAVNVATTTTTTTSPTEQQTDVLKSSPTTTTSSNAIVGLTFFYTIPCGGLCEDAYQLFSASVKQLHQALWAALEVNQASGLKSDTNMAKVDKTTLGVTQDDSTNASQNRDANATSSLTNAKRWLSKRLFAAQFEIPKSAVLGSAYEGKDNANKDSTSYGPIVKDKGPKGTLIFDFPTVTVGTSGTPASSIEGYSGPMTAAGLWFKGLRPQLLSLHREYCKGLEEVAGHLERIQKEETEEDKGSSKSPKGPTAKELKGVLASIPQHKEWVTFCAILAVEPVVTVTNTEGQNQETADSSQSSGLTADHLLADTFRAALLSQHSLVVTEVQAPAAANDATQSAEAKENKDSAARPSDNIPHDDVLSSVLDDSAESPKDRIINISDYDFLDGVLAL